MLAVAEAVLRNRNYTLGYVCVYSEKLRANSASLYSFKVINPAY